MLVRREAAAAVGYLDPDFFVYSDETDFCKRLRDAGWRMLYVPGARAVHHDQLTHRPARRAAADRGVPPQPRPLHAQAPLPRHAAAVRALLGLGLPRAARCAAVALPGHDPRRYLLHARQELRPGRGEGIREAAEEYNRRARIAPRRRWSDPDLAQLAACVAAAGARCCCSPGAGGCRCSAGLALLGAAEAGLAVLARRRPRSTS